MQHEGKEEIKACITITVPCLLLNLSLVMGWYFGVLMNEELHSKAFEPTNIYAPILHHI